MSSDKQEAANQQQVRVIKPNQFDDNTPQTPGMQRVAAVSKQLAGSQGLWAGITVVAPHVASGIHHHVEPGDFIYVPPFAPHQEINPSPDTPSQWVIVRNSQEPIVVNLEPGDVGQP